MTVFFTSGILLLPLVEQYAYQNQFWLHQILVPSYHHQICFAEVFLKPIKYECKLLIFNMETKINTLELLDYKRFTLKNWVNSSWDIYKGLVKNRNTCGFYQIA